MFLHLTLQSSAIIIKSPYVITYVCQNFGVRDVGKYQKAYIRRHIFYLGVSRFSKQLILSFYLNRMNDSVKSFIEISFKKSTP